MTNPLRSLERWFRGVRNRWRHARDCRRLVRRARRVCVESLVGRCADLPCVEYVPVTAASAGRPLEAIRTAINSTTAAWIAVHDASARLCEDADLWIGLELAAQPRARALYGDHVEAGAKEPHLKPDFSWLYLLATDYVAPLVVYDRTLLESALGRIIGRGTNPTSPRAALYALALEALNGLGAHEVIHVRQPLAILPAVTGLDPGSDESLLPGLAAQALAARGIDSTCRPSHFDPRWHEFHFHRRSSPRVSVVIPTKNAAALVKKCLASFRAAAGYEGYEIVVIDHDSEEPELREFLAAESSAGRLRVFPYSGSFNYAAMNNAAVRSTTSELVLFLNNDIEDFSRGCLDQLVATLQLDDAIAAVGCLLHYADGDIQHAGVIFNPKRLCIHAHVGLPHDAAGYQGRIRTLQEFSAVTAALMLVRRSAFESVGGFDEVFPDDYNDVDLCLRLRAAGHRVVYTPHVQATHWESRTRRVKETAKDVFIARWSGYFARDPFYSPHLSHTEFLPDRLSHLWRERKSVALVEAVQQHASRRHSRAL